MTKLKWTRRRRKAFVKAAKLLNLELKKSGHNHHSVEIDGSTEASFIESEAGGFGSDISPDYWRIGSFGVSLVFKVPKNKRVTKEIRGF